LAFATDEADGEAEGGGVGELVPAVLEKVGVAGGLGELPAEPPPDVGGDPKPIPGGDINPAAGDFEAALELGDPAEASPFKRSAIKTG
jgi:hypothetical protein